MLSRCLSMPEPQRGHEENWLSFPAMQQQILSFSPGCSHKIWDGTRPGCYQGWLGLVLGPRLNEECVRHRAYLL